MLSVTEKVVMVAWCIPFATKRMSNLHVCPYCSFSRSWIIRRHKRKCKRCKKEFSAQHYPVSGFHMTSEEWKHAAHAFITKKTVRTIAAALSIGTRKAQHLAHYFRCMIAGISMKPFEGPVEIDETYIGGQRKNKRLHIRRLEPSKCGLGTQKLPIFGILDRTSGTVYVEVLPHTLDISHIQMRICELVKPGAVVYTDGFPRYQVLPTLGYKHEWVEHTKGEYVRGMIHTNNIEGFWGILKRTMGCIGGMRRARLHLFAKEIAWHFNHRKYSLEEKITLLLSASNIS